MTLPTTQWLLLYSDEHVEDLLISELGLSPLLAKILSARQIKTPEEAKKFLNPSLHDLYSPFLMKDMEEGVRRLIQAIHRGEKIVIYGDYDADGVTSVVLLLKFLKEIGVEAGYYIPHRLKEGYGLKQEVLADMRERGVSLIVSVDCGISDYEPVLFARSVGVDIIILDHHEIPGIVPACVAAINPHREDCFFPFKHLAAVGIVFNFLIALRGRLRQEGFWTNRVYPNLKKYLDLVALGTIGDISPLLDENRIFTKVGIELINADNRIGIKALKEVCGVENQPLDVNRLSFTLLPRINAAGRVASADDAVNLLLTEDWEEARTLARKLEEYNRRRQTLEKAIIQDILKEVEEKGAWEEAGSLVFASPNWHPGVVGIVASRLAEHFLRPVFLISIKDGIGRGSGRSIADFDIYEGLKKCASYLLTFGGHRYAAGISLREEDIDAFTQRLDQVVKAQLDPTKIFTQTFIDGQCRLKDINYDLLCEIDKLAPFGNRNPEPVFCVRNVNVTESTVVGNNHLRIKVNDNGVSCNSIWYGKGDYLNHLPRHLLDIAFTPQVVDWHKSSDILLKMRDISLSSLS